MYCPKCAAPIDGVKFCRQCGANVSLVPQALTGQLPAPIQAAPPAAPTQDATYGRRRKHQQSEPPSMAHAFNNVLIGLGFLAAVGIVMRFSPGGMSWGWAFIFPAMGAFGKAVSEYYRAAETRQSSAWQSPATPSLPIQSVTPSIPVQVPTTSELKLPAAAQDLAQPVSVTEHTTALLEPTRQKSLTSN